MPQYEVEGEKKQKGQQKFYEANHRIAKSNVSLRMLWPDKLTLQA